MNESRSRVNRRDMLRGLRKRPPSAANPAPGPLLDRPAPDRSELLRASRPAMGSFFEVRVPAHVPGAAGLATSALDLIEDLEAQLTVYRDDSEVSRINALAHEKPIPVEPRLFALLERAVSIWRETGGAYDVAAGALSVAWGFFKGPRRVPEPEILAETRDRTGSIHLTLDRQARTVSFDRPGVLINLGSIGKGYAIDRAAALIREFPWPTSALIHGGQSSLYALGSPPGIFGGRWAISVRNPFDPANPVGTLHVRNRGVGTSGAAFQQFEAGGRLYGHILDPRTGEPPSEGPASVTVLAPTAAEADALSTAFYLLGPPGAEEYAKNHPDVSALFILDDSGAPKLHLVNLTEADFQPNAEGTLLRNRV